MRSGITKKFCILGGGCGWGFPILLFFRLRFALKISFGLILFGNVIL
jgi:hypothetical protein